ncbi:MAG: AI-2E family transporter [Lachnospiraceae bacterium]|nr:AI-2E family transporter [Lachnospiraceae bacterium]
MILDEICYANRMFTGFISGRIVDSLIIGVICFAGMLLLGIPNRMLVSVITGVTNVIPFFGPYIGAIPSFLLILMVSPAKAVEFLIFILILQQFDGNILGPRILGNKTGLSSFWVLFSILLFGGLFGFVGMIIGVPVFAVIYDILRKLVNKGVAYQETK